jgi:transcriptional regulator with XRE-family HTH domain
MRKLETTTDLLDALMERYGWTSDRQIAEAIEVPQTTLSSWRRGRTYPTEVHALTLARWLNIPPAMVLVIAAADRVEDPDARHEWQKIVRQIARAGTGALAALLIGTGTYTPSAKADTPRMYIMTNPYII